MCTRIYHWHYLSPLVPSVLSRVGAEIGPTFWKLQKCAAFPGYVLFWLLLLCASSSLDGGRVCHLKRQRCRCSRALRQVFKLRVPRIPSDL